MSDSLPLNVKNEPLKPCSHEPKTGFFRDGSCRTNNQDHGRHTVCTIVTEEFLVYTKSKGNDLSTPNPLFGFPGLKPGDGWCLCATRWLEAYKDGCAPRVNLDCTEISTLDIIPEDILFSHSEILH